MDKQQIESLELLTTLLETVRGIASEAVGGRYALGGARFTNNPEKACFAIQALVDAAHNLPAAIQPGGPAFLLEDSLARTQDVLRNIASFAIDTDSAKL